MVKKSPSITSDGQYDIGAVMTAHGEGALAAVSLTSFLDCCSHAEERGLRVQKILVLDRATRQTKAVFEGMDEPGLIVVETDFGDQGKVRNYAATKLCTAETIAFLDGDDLWGDNWLTKGYDFLKAHGEKTIAHPEFSLFFQGVSSVLINIDQEESLYDENFLRFANYWDAMCMTFRSTHVAHPYCDRRIKDGFAFEDWHWNCETIVGGFVHKVVPDTLHYKRRRQNSQTIEASGNRSLMPETELTNFQYSKAS